MSVGAWLSEGSYRFCRGVNRRGAGKKEFPELFEPGKRGVTDFAWRRLVALWIPGCRTDSEVSEKEDAAEKVWNAHSDEKYHMGDL